MQSVLKLNMSMAISAGIFGVVKVMLFHKEQLIFLKNIKLVYLVQSHVNQKMLLIKNLIHH